MEIVRKYEIWSALRRNGYDIDIMYIASDCIAPPVPEHRRGEILSDPECREIPVNLYFPIDSTGFRVVGSIRVIGEATVVSPVMKQFQW